VHLRLAALVAELHVRDAETRDGVPDGLHQARVSCRRLRAALATFGPILVRDVTDPIRDDLKWLAGSLGGARDAEVLRERLHRMVLEEVADGDRDVVLVRIDGVLGELEASARTQVEAALEAERSHALLAALDRLIAHPPWTGQAKKPADTRLRRRLKREHRRVEREVARALHAQDHPAAYDEALHDVRKAVKRLRYACEVAEPVLGEEASAQLAAARELTRAMGERQDVVLTRGLLPRLQAGAAEAGEPTEPWEALRRKEAERADHIACETLDMLKSGTLSAGVAVREK
jgi:CHAD domain-containing protein